MDMKKILSAIIAGTMAISAMGMTAMAEESVTALQGKGTESEPYTISSLAELNFFRDTVNSKDTTYNTEGVYVALGADIDMSGTDWSVNIGDDCSYTFDGIFDGKNYTISNLTSTETGQKSDGYVCTGLFGAIYGSAQVKNLTIKNATINTGSYTGNNVGAVVGFAYNSTGAVENIKVTGDVKIDAEGIYGVGTVVGYSYAGDLKINNCSVEANEGSYIKAKSGVGGIIGYGGTTDVNASSVKNLSISANGLVGGVAGLLNSGGSVTACSVENVALTATGEYWGNSAAVAVGTIASTSNITVSDVTYSGVTTNNVTAENLIGSTYVEKPTEVVPAIVAQINGVYYTTLADAVAAAESGDEIALLSDITLTESITIEADDNITIDLNGYTVSHTSAAEKSYQMITNNGSLTIKDSSAEADGKISFVYNGVGDPAFGWGSYTILSTGDLTVESGTVEMLCDLNTAASVNHMYCAIQQSGGSTVINGGTISTPTYRSLRVNRGTLEINGGVMDGQVWVQPFGDGIEVDINGGEFSPNGSDGSSVYITNDSKAVALAVTDGTFTTKIGCSDATALAGAITGGTFTAAAVSGTNSALLADGYEFVENADGTYGVTEETTGITAVNEIKGVYAGTGANADDKATAVISTVTINGSVDGIVWTFEDLSAQTDTAWTDATVVYGLIIPYAVESVDTMQVSAK